MRLGIVFSFVATLSNVAVLASEAQEPLQAGDNHQRHDLGAIPIDSFTKVHEVVLTMEELTKPSPGQHAEHKSLLQRLARSQGKWDKNHPRHRLLDALHGFADYKGRQTADLDKWKKFYKNVPKQQKKLLETAVDYPNKLETVGSLIDLNQQLCDQVVEAGLAFYQVERKELDEHIAAVEKEGKTADKMSVSQALKHYVRDWSVGGASERDAAFPCILDSLQNLFPDRSEKDDDIKVLLPGAGVGRLGHNVAALGGFEVTSNEWSMYMNLAYRFLASNPRVGSNAAHPFIDSWSHHATTPDMLRGVTFPDTAVNASAVLLVEGDFTRAFEKQNGHFDVVVTHFFIDTARNLLAYFDTIYATLKRGGYWVNFGPLLYGTGPWVQLSLEEIVAVVEAMGFEFVDAPEVCGEVTLEGRKVRGREAAYGFNKRALTKHAYEAQAWILRKK